LRPIPAAGNGPAVILSGGMSSNYKYCELVSNPAGKYPPERRVQFIPFCYHLFVLLFKNCFRFPVFIHPRRRAARLKWLLAFVAVFPAAGLAPAPELVRRLYQAGLVLLECF